MNINEFVIPLALLAALDYRLGGMRGAPFRYPTAVMVTWLSLDSLATIVQWLGYSGDWAWLYIIWFGAGELSGWKPKFAKEKGDWWKTGFYGLVLGGIGIILVPLSIWLHRRFLFQPPAHWPRWARELLASDAQNEGWFGPLAILLGPPMWAGIARLVVP